MKVTAGVGIFGNKLKWLHRSCAPKLYQRERQPRKTENELTSGLKPKPNHNPNPNPKPNTEPNTKSNPKKRN